MSRSMTAAQVIALGEYLDPDFDPTTLTVNQLLGVFGFHNIRYPTPYTKPKLVQLFNDEIKPKMKQFKKDKHKKETSLASDNGIKDGITGHFLNEDSNKSLRRSSRRGSRAPSSEAEPQAEAPKRRRSAQPALGALATRPSQPVQPVLVEESEPEDDIPPRKTLRAKKSTEDAASHTRRSSNFAEDSGWEDNNVFQSAAESSSPARPPPKPRTRKATAPKASTTTRKSSRKATSAPPEYLPTITSRNRNAEKNDNIVQRSPFKFITSPFKPFSPLRVVETGRTIEGAQEDDVGEEILKQIVEEEASAADAEHAVEDASETDELDELDESEDGKQDLAISHSSVDDPVARTSSRPGASRLFRFFVVIALLLVYSIVGPYKAQSAALGYCDPDSKTNDILERLRTRTAAIEACNRENRTFLYLPTPGLEEEPCPAPPILPFTPDECTPCPEHAACTFDSVSCEHGFLLRPHPLLAFISLPSSNTLSPDSKISPLANAVLKFIAATVDGMPGFGPVALPPRCVEDPKRKRHIGVLGKAIEAVLGLERGKRLCAGKVPHVLDTEGGEAKRWGMHLDALREAMKAKTAPQLQSTFEDTFGEAIQQLVTWGGVITGEGPTGARYIAHKTPNLDWTCSFTVKSRETWTEWRTTVLGTVISVLGMYVLSRRRARSRVEDKRVAELVQLALAILRNQEIAHHTDPVTAPAPYLSSVQLRDLVLQEEHSVAARARLWARVERIVEGNANVRANLEEVPGGDELRVWRWVGGSGRRKAVEYDSAAGQRVVA
ncbi:Man1-Src1p-C-terminal domain-containing protein [Russula earlei]|uniref:Man1-Src1p-C-terminal domain-containing protein n=1 Tax=Russula earlei TaxID=71964 RepID=A0ACC0U1T1_9AGAM|nr:Man1-Src1p-C-terminal domain-containing protein [Russula earlei]